MSGADLFEKIGSFSQRRAPWVIAAWVLLALGLTVLAPSLAEVGVQDDADFLPADSPSQQADAVVRRQFPDDPKRDAALVVLSRDGGLDPQDRAWFARWAEATGRLPGVERIQTAATDPKLGALLRSEDGAAELALVDLRVAPFTPRGHDLVAALRSSLGDAPRGLEGHVTGLAGLAADQADAIQRSFDRTAIVTVLLVLAILIAVYRSIVAPLVPLASIALAFLVARGVVGILAGNGLRVASLAETFMILIVFGAGTDYCLFLVSRYREELAGGRALGETVRRTSRVIGPVLAASAATVIVGFLAQLTARFGLFRTMGPALAIAVSVALLAGLTLTPALLTLAGRHAFWPTSLDQVRGRADLPSRLWTRVAAAVRARPAEILLAGAIAMLLPAAGLGWLRPTFDLVRELPAGADSREGFEVLEQHLPGGRLSPAYVLLTAPRPILTDENTAAIDRLTEALRSVPGVGEVRSITQPAGIPLTPERASRLARAGDAAALGLDPNTVDLGPLLAAMERPGGLRFDASTLAAYPTLRDQIGSYFLGGDGRTTRLMVSLEGNPFAPGARTVFHRLDDVAAGELAGGPLAGAQLRLGGPSSFYVDIQDIASADARTMAAVLFAGIFVVLALLLRSAVAPFYLLATVLASFGATLGLTAIVFQGILGEPGISFLVTPLLLIILVALGADYNIFVTSRIREELADGQAPADAAARGLVQTGKVISSAGLILAGTFAALILTPMPNLRQMGFAVAAGILIDTFIVRSTLVPAATVLLGRWAFWPGYQRDRAERLRPAHLRLAALSVVALAGLLVAVFLVPEPPPSQRIAAAPTVAGRAAGAAASVETTETTIPPTASTTSTTSTALTAPAPPTTQPAGHGAAPAPAGPRRLAVPRPGSWQYRIEGTRRIGLAGTDQPFSEDLRTDVTRIARDVVQVSSSSTAGEEEDHWRFSERTIELLSTRRASGGMSFGGELRPPQTLFRHLAAVGETWAGSWTAGGIQGRSAARITGEHDVVVAGANHRCTEVTIDTTFSGEAEGRQHSVTCWIVELGMAAASDERFEGTYGGVPFAVRSSRRLVAPPS